MENEIILRRAKEKIYAGHLYQQDWHNVIDIIFLYFPLEKGHVPANMW